MGRLTLIFAALLMLSAMSLVTARFQSRQLFVASDRLDARARELDTEWRRLQLARAESARNARIDRVARQDLEMVSMSPPQTVYLKGKDRAAAAGSSAAGTAAGAQP